MEMGAREKISDAIAANQRRLDEMQSMDGTFALGQLEAREEILSHMGGLIEASKLLDEDVCWRPIETAPKDGSAVIIGYVGIDGVLVGKFNAERDKWYLSSPEWIKLTRQPSHWMPMPAPPQERED